MRESQAVIYSPQRQNTHLGTDETKKTEEVYRSSAKKSQKENYIYESPNYKKKTASSQSPSTMKKSQAKTTNQPSIIASKTGKNARTTSETLASKKYETKNSDQKKRITKQTESSPQKTNDSFKNELKAKISHVKALIETTQSRVPFKQKSHSLKPEGLLHFEEFDPTLLSTKVQSTKNSDYKGHNSNSKPAKRFLNENYPEDIAYTIPEDFEGTNLLTQQTDDDEQQQFGKKPTSKGTVKRKPVKTQAGASAKKLEEKYKRIGRNRQSLPENLKENETKPSEFSSSRLFDREMTEPSEIITQPNSSKSHRGVRLHTENIRLPTKNDNVKSKPKSEVGLNLNQLGKNRNSVTESAYYDSKISKHSSPKGMSLAFNTKMKRPSDSQIRNLDQFGYYSNHKTNLVLSTRSAVDRQQYQNALNFHTEGNEIHRGGPKDLKLNKESMKIYCAPEYDGTQGDHVVSNLLKGYNLKDLKINPNAKFLLLRKQLHKKRDQPIFKSADWNTFEVTKQQQKSTNVQTSPNRELNSTFSKSPPRKEQNSTENLNLEGFNKERLFEVFLKTKKVLSQYKAREQDWKNEKLFFVQEIQRLQNIINTELNFSDQ